MSCFRCGRRGHWIDSCYASTDVRGVPISDDSFDDDGGNDGVYALVTSRGVHYVGKSEDIDGRIARCLSGEIFTRVPLLTRGYVHDLESWERDETLTRMLRYGISSVKGSAFVSRTLSDEDWACAFNQVCDRFELCRKCGRDTHFADACFARIMARWAA